MLRALLCTNHSPDHCDGGYFHSSGDPLCSLLGSTSMEEEEEKETEPGRSGRWSGTARTSIVLKETYLFPAIHSGHKIICLYRSYSCSDFGVAAHAQSR